MAHEPDLGRHLFEEITLLALPRILLTLTEYSAGKKNSIYSQVFYLKTPILYSDTPTQAAFAMCYTAVILLEKTLKITNSKYAKEPSQNLRFFNMVVSE